MDYLIGVCGIGYGHCTRQLTLAKKLRAAGHKVRVVGFGNVPQFFKQHGFHAEQVWVPFLPEGKAGLDYAASVKRNILTALPGLIQNRKVRQKVFKAGIPDAFISDYEPVTARMAYATNRPLVLLDQQSKLRYWNFDPIGRYNREADAKRLSLFFPTFTKSFVVSFYNLPPISDTRVEVISTPLPESICNATPKYDNSIVIYLSSYGGAGTRQNIDDICAVFESIPDYNFKIYQSPGEPLKQNHRKNVEFKQFCRDGFIEDMINCSGIVSTAGHTIISEALYLKKPIFVLPLVTFDQQLCAEIIEKERLGMRADYITRENMLRFTNSLPELRQRICNCSRLLKCGDPLTKVVDFLENL